MKKINLKGPIVTNSQKRIYDWLGMEACCPDDLINELPENNEEIELMVNSPGGIVDAGSEIYTALKEYKGHITAKIVGIAASAMSVAVMGADKTLISPTARMMIHNARRGAEGDYRGMDAAGNSLRTADIGIKNAYKSKTSLSEEKLTELMDKETYMDAKTAVEMGFADEVMFQEENQSEELVASIGTNLLSESTIDKVRNILVAEIPASSEGNHSKVAEIKQMKNELLKEEIMNSLN